MYKTLDDTRIISVSEVEELGITIENTSFERFTSFSHIAEKESIFIEEPEYIMISSYLYDRYIKDDPRHPGKYTEKLEYYEMLDSEYTLVYEIRPIKIIEMLEMLTFC